MPTEIRTSSSTIPHSRLLAGVKSRFDAVAGLIIVFIHLIGRILIGVAQQGLSMSEAATNYDLLTVGDGLVSQIPALIVSVGAGMLVMALAFWMYSVAAAMLRVRSMIRARG
jgi:flagellar biosynthesis component FlhA